MNNKWFSIYGYENLYWVNKDGQVKSNRKILSPQKDTGGYLQVSLYKNKIKKITLVHRIVAKTFIKNKKNKYAINHKDNNRSNNNVSNLEWVTRKENMEHSSKQKRMIGRKGELSHLSKLTIKQIKEIRSISGVSQISIAKKYGISYRNLRHILTKKTWQNV